MNGFCAFADRDTFTKAAAAFIDERLRAALRVSEQATLVLSGGRTPGPIYDALSGASLDWSKVRVTLSDDRDVPPSDPNSNARLVRETLLRNNAARAQFAPLAPGHVDPAWLPFDVTVLGMGEDGHIASLFPGAQGIAAALDPEAVPACVALVPDPLPPEAPYPRLTLTLSALIASRAILLLLTGEAKRRVYEQALQGKDAGNLPVGAILAQGNAPVSVFWVP